MKIKDVIMRLLDLDKDGETEFSLADSDFGDSLAEELTKEDFYYNEAENVVLLRVPRRIPYDG